MSDYYPEVDEAVDVNAVERIVTRSNVELKGANPAAADIEPFPRLEQQSGAGAAVMAPFTSPDGNGTTERGADGYPAVAEEVAELEYIEIPDPPKEN